MLLGPELKLCTVSAFSLGRQKSLSDLPFRLVFVANFVIMENIMTDGLKCHICTKTKTTLGPNVTDSIGEDRFTLMFKQWNQNAANKGNVLTLKFMNKLQSKQSGEKLYMEIAFN